MRIRYRRGMWKRRKNRKTRCRRESDGGGVGEMRRYRRREKGEERKGGGGIGEKHHGELRALAGSISEDELMRKLEFQDQEIDKSGEGREW